MSLCLSVCHLKKKKCHWQGGVPKKKGLKKLVSQPPPKKVFHKRKKSILPKKSFDKKNLLKKVIIGGCIWQRQSLAQPRSYVAKPHESC